MPVVVVIVGLGFCAGDVFFFTLLGLSIVLEPVIPIAGLVFVGGMTVLGSVTYVLSLSEAIASKDVRWTMDHFLAPFVGTMFTIWVMLPFYRDSFIPLLQSFAHHQSFVEIGAGFCISILWWVLAFVGPIVAVISMASGDRTQRLASYGGFLATAATWGVLLAVAVR